MNPNRPARLNRAVLAILGVLTLAAGGFVLLLGTGVLRVSAPVPMSADAPLIPANTTLQSWVPWAVAPAAAIVALLALRWLVAQTMRRPRSRDWQLAPDTRHGSTRIDSDAAAEPLREEIADYPGVLAATAHLTGPRTHPQLHLRVTTDDRADITGLRRQIDTEAIPRLTRALDLPALPADLLLRLDTTSGARAL
jgi:hypothetical protein